ncbi:archaeosortase family protein ArtE [Methanotorris formicicus]|uniref:Exosortase EpsH-related protein n=1 Tax=Methanotorris formicicus Mc-S-70 TaxID=647171 RepID=H1KYP0_9EURY|nr:archaeosortase family protein ArtE [Methanotorris formicicus]EHP86944.1 Exosortase EpsH-related protein [Methanotorris formicicus Mc-S-70]
MDKWEKTILKFFILTPIVYIIMKPLENFLIKYVTFHSYLILKMFEECYLEGNIIHLSNLSIEVIGVCTGVSLMAIYISLVIVTAKNFKEFILGSFIGISLIYFGNIIRICLIAFIGTHETYNIQTIHDIISYIDVPITVFAALLWLKIQDLINR